MADAGLGGEDASMTSMLPAAVAKWSWSFGTTQVAVLYYRALLMALELLLNAEASVVVSH